MDCGRAVSPGWRAGPVLGAPEFPRVFVQSLSEAAKAPEMLCRKAPWFYAKGVVQHRPGSRQRTLGRQMPRMTYPERVLQAASLALCNPFRVDEPGVSRPQGALPRPWAVLCNAVGVKRRGTILRPAPLTVLALLLSALQIAAAPPPPTYWQDVRPVFRKN